MNTVEPYTGPTLTALEMFRDFFSGQWDEARIRRHLAAPIALRDRAELERKLAELPAGPG
jgi:hypothetical protein